MPSKESLYLASSLYKEFFMVQEIPPLIRVREANFTNELCSFFLWSQISTLLCALD